jgi:penicillin-binding protein 2
MASIANDGEILKPYLAKKITNENNGITFSQSKKTLSNLNFKQDYFNIINNGMRKVITMGSAGILQNIKMKVAGKTGTPQIAAGTKTNAFFVSFAPYEDPEILLLIMLEEPPEGSITTIPIADKILK